MDRAQPWPEPARAGRASAALAGGLVAALAAALAAACGGAREADRPIPTLAASREAQAELRPLHARWESSPRASHRELEAPLRRFRERFAADPGARLAGAMLAAIALEAGDLDEADRLAKGALTGPPGATRDLAIVVSAGLERRRGRPAETLARLAPLAHKIVDPAARELANEEYALAALDARRFDDAMEALRVWLRESGDRAATHARIEALLARVPAAELVGDLERAGAGGEAEGLAALVAKRLAGLVVAGRDAALAKRLLAAAGSLLGEEGDVVAKLAAGAGAARVAGPTVGLLLSLRSDEARRRGIEVASGVAHGLGLPGSSARLVSRDDGGSLERVDEALRALSSEGAAVVIAGLDADEAAIAARFAEAHALPVVLLAPPPRGEGASDGRYAFVLGVEEKDEQAILEDALRARGASWIGRARPDACAALPAEARRGEPALVILGPPVCAREAWAAARAAPLRVRLGLGLDAGLADAAEGAVAVRAGLYPPGAGARGEVASWAAWIAARGAPPSFWAGLGHDAAVLAWEGVRGLPARVTEEPREVEARREAARAALAAAEGELWTTEARGLGGARVLARSLGVVEVGARGR
jgi:hypothetical protein